MKALDSIWEISVKNSFGSTLMRNLHSLAVAMRVKESVTPLFDGCKIDVGRWVIR